MKVDRISCFVWIIFLLLNGFPVFAAMAKTQKTLCKVGYSIQSVADVDPRDAEAALRVWVTELAAQYDFQVDIKLYKSVDVLVADFTSGKLDFITLSSIDYLRMARVVKVKPDVTQFRNGKATVKYVVLTGNEIKKKGLPALRNKKLAIAKRNQLGQAYLDVYLVQNKLPVSEHFFAAVQEKNKDSQAILDTFFGQTDACLVTEAAFKTMQELNPQVGSKLHILAESPDLIASVGIFRSDYPVDLKQRALKGMSSDYVHHERGRQIILLFNVEKMELISDDQLNSVQKLMADYNRFKNRQQ